MWINFQGRHEIQTAMQRASSMRLEVLVEENFTRFFRKQIESAKFSRVQVVALDRLVLEVLKFSRVQVVALDRLVLAVLPVQEA
jgi:hypothetical protein